MPHEKRLRVFTQEQLDAYLCGYYWGRRSASAHERPDGELATYYDKGWAIGVEDQDPSEEFD